MSFFSKIRVGVLRGGPSSEYEVSLKTGAAVLKNLPDEKYHPVDIFISKEGVWHINGAESEPHKILKNADVIFNALHGEYGEDGNVQNFLDQHKVHYTGSRTFGASLAMNKVLAKKFLMRHGVQTPVFAVLKKEDTDYDRLADVFKKFPQPSVVKPVSAGSSVGVSVVRNFGDFVDAVEKVFSFFDSAIVEEMIAGKEATCGAVENFRGAPVYSLLPVEIVPPPERQFFDYEAKYGGGSKEICPGNFSAGESAELQRLAALAHSALSQRHYSRSDFIVSPSRGIYFLETNSLPGLTNESLLPKSLSAVGCSYPQFLDHLLTLAMDRK